MTRFARAKGSKSSNERLPNESTPWHVMKQQLESSLNKEQVSETKTKSAKQLLNEKDDLYYAQSIGNVNTDWAEFETSKVKTNSVKNDTIKKKSKDKNKKLKKALIESAPEKNNTNIITKINDTSTPLEELKNKKGKRKQKTEDLTTECDSNEILQTKKSKVKKKDLTLKNDTEDKSVPNDSENKFSKRQKRNQKKQNQKNEDNTESKSNTKFNVDGNDWDNSVNFNQRRKFINNYDKNKLNPDFNFKNFRRFGNNVPKKYQKKTAKVRDEKEHNRRKPDNESVKITINGMDVEIVKYDGYPVKKEDAERLILLRKEMVLKGIPKIEIDAAMKLERRKCEKALSRIRKQVCFHCRKAGHNLSECPELEREEIGTGICFKCGSTEHTHFECKVHKSDDYRYAKCFICREQGHIAKQCPDNPKGLYPDGGSCKICGDVTHLKKDCPDLVKEKEEHAITLDTIKDTNLELLDNDTKKPIAQVKTNKKIVKF